MERIKRVLFLSRGNASRAQMAEGFLRSLAGDRFASLSVGTESGSVNPLAKDVMSEIGIDISSLTPREVASLFRETIHYAVALCDEPRERHPLFPFATNMLQWSVLDPDAATGDPEAKRKVFRQVREQIRSNVKALIEAINQPEKVVAKAESKAA
jgi:arsenate reductase